MDASAAYRKIELQSAEDFTYLINNVRRAAADSINAAFPPVESTDGHDELRVRIEELVNDYITRTFTLAAPNLSINGLDVDPEPFLSESPGTAAAAEERHEPFDGRKRARVEDLAREEEDLLREIAALKRRVPASAAASFAEQVRAGLLADEQALAAARDAAVATVGPRKGPGGDGEREGGGDGGEEGEAEGEQADGLALTPLERQESVEQSFSDAVVSLGKLMREMPATVAKMERARVAAEYVVTER